MNHLNIWETIGMAWVVFTSALGTIGMLYAAWQFLKRAKVAILRGIVEENLDIERAWEKRTIERMTR